MTFHTACSACAQWFSALVVPDSEEQLPPDATVCVEGHAIPGGAVGSCLQPCAAALLLHPHYWQAQLLHGHGIKQG